MWSDLMTEYSLAKLHKFEFHLQSCPYQNSLQKTINYNFPYLDMNIPALKSTLY